MPGSFLPKEPASQCLRTSLGKINLLSFGNESRRGISVKGWSNLDSVSWTADGRALLASVRMLKGTTLLRTDLQGQALVLSKPEGGRATYTVRSPDGRHVALSGCTLNSNILDDGNFYAIRPHSAGKVVLPGALWLFKQPGGLSKC
jgi:hypothetical protein